MQKVHKYGENKVISRGVSGGVVSCRHELWDTPPVGEGRGL